MQVFDNDQQWHVHHGDCIPHMLQDMPDESVDFAIFSPPFPALYAYLDSVADIGNVDAIGGEAAVHLSFMFNGLYRVLKPGRAAIVHVAQIPRMKRSGGVGLSDFRGTNIRLGERAGLTYEYDWMIRKNPQSQALRTRSRELQFAGLESDRAASRGTLQDYLIKFRKPGVNAVPVRDWGQELDDDGNVIDGKVDKYDAQVTRNDWIKFAEGCWDDIQETDTLNTAAAKSEDDTRHICVAAGSLVLTSYGYTPIESVNVGDEVLTHRGNWKKVLAKQCNGIRETVRIKAQGVPGLKVTPDHMVWARCGAGKGRWPSSKPGVSHPKSQARKASPEWKAASELKGCYVNLPLPPVEKSEWTENEWWIAGRWLGDEHWDSCARPALHISCGRHEVDSLKDRLGSYAGGVHDTGTSFQIRIKDADGRLRRLISKFGKLASCKIVPREAICLEPLIAKHFLDGYFSADGHYVESYDKMMASSVSRSLLLGIAMIMQRVYGVVCSVYAGRKAGVCTIAGRVVNTKDDWILSAAMSPRNSHGFIAPDGAWKRVDKLEDSELAEVWDLQVEDDESFVVEGCAVHNCPLQLEVIRRCILLYTNPGEIVFSPFTGIGSEGYVALGGKSPKTGKAISEPRRFYGCELKPEYHKQACINLERAVSNASGGKQKSLFVET
jgi:hypothetical protein